MNDSFKKVLWDTVKCFIIAPIIIGFFGTVINNFLSLVVFKNNDFLIVGQKIIIDTTLVVEPIMVLWFFIVKPMIPKK